MIITLELNDKEVSFLNKMVNDMASYEKITIIQQLRCRMTLIRYVELHKTGVIKSEVIEKCRKLATNNF